LESGSWDLDLPRRKQIFQEAAEEVQKECPQMNPFLGEMEILANSPDVMEAIRKNESFAKITGLLDSFFTSTNDIESRSHPTMLEGFFGEVLDAPEESINLFSKKEKEEPRITELQENKIFSIHPKLTLPPKNQNLSKSGNQGDPPKWSPFSSLSSDIRPPTLSGLLQSQPISSTILLLSKTKRVTDAIHMKLAGGNFGDPPSDSSNSLVVKLILVVIVGIMIIGDPKRAAKLVSSAFKFVWNNWLKEKMKVEL